MRFLFYWHSKHTWPERGNAQLRLLTGTSAVSLITASLMIRWRQGQQVLLMLVVAQKQHPHTSLALSVPHYFSFPVIISLFFSFFFFSE